MTVEEYLKKHNMKQRELSRLSGVSPNAISKLAKGEGRFGVQTANKLAKLGISIPKEMVLTPSEKGKMGGEKAKLLRESADENGNVKNSDIIRILDDKKITAEKSKSVKISSDTFSRYFEPSAKPKQVAETIEKALEFYFKNLQE